MQNFSVFCFTKFRQTINNERQSMSFWIFKLFNVYKFKQIPIYKLQTISGSSVAKYIWRLLRSNIWQILCLEWFHPLKHCITLTISMLIWKGGKKDKNWMLNLVYCICVESIDPVFRVFYSDPNPNASSIFHTARMYIRPKG